MTERFYPFERRTHTRFKISGATVVLGPAEADAPLPPPSGNVGLVDISVGGLSFASEEEIEFGAEFRFVVHLPEQEPMHLLGRVKWKGRGPNVPGYVYGVEFARYGVAPRENNPEYEKVLLALEASVLEHEVE